MGLMGSALGCAIGTIWIGAQSRRRDASIEMSGAVVGLLLMGVGLVATVLLGGWGGELAGSMDWRKLLGITGSVLAIGIGVTACWMMFVLQLVAVLAAAFGSTGIDVYKRNSPEAEPARWRMDLEQIETREGGQ